jgi:predicted amidohydrolase
MFMGDGVLTIETLLEGVELDKPDECPFWPPDVFAIAGALLKRSGAYMAVFDLRKNDDFLSDVASLGQHWRKSIDRLKQPTKKNLSDARPDALKDSWTELYRERSRPINDIGDSKALTRHLIRMMLIADEASAGIGVDWDNGKDDEGQRIESFFLSLAEKVRAERGDLFTFGWMVSPHVVCVLGKQHTPQVGATFRSLSHYLSLYLPNDIKARWHGPYQQWQEASDSTTRVNLLLLPWPENIESSDFLEVPNSGVAARGRRNDTDEEPPGYFKFRPKVTITLERFRRALRRALAAARQHANQIDAVVFPEAALTFEQYEVAEQIAIEQRVILICGVRVIARGDGRDVNLSVIQPAGVIQEGGATVRTRKRLAEAVRLMQPKHHRWCLTREQLVAYQLAGRLSVARNWWEDIILPQRELYFLTLNRLTWSVLICEDLARQDPAADLIRAVGPNLLIALLMDGPQRKDRWAARYASVLAEDPGTSVLSITSLGMAERSRPFLRTTGQRADPSRVIALWRDQINGEVEICLDAGQNACVLSLECKLRKEYSADGRHDDKKSCYPVFAGFKSFQN